MIIFQFQTMSRHLHSDDILMVLSLRQQRSAGNVSSCPNSRGILNATNAAVGSPRDRARATTCTICFLYAFSEWCAIAVFNRLLHRKSVLCNCVKLIGGNKLPGFVRPTTRATHKARERSRGRGLEGGRSERVFTIFHGKFNR